MPRKAQGRINGRPPPKAIPQPAGGVRLETFIPWTLVKRGMRRQAITPIETPAPFLESVESEKELRAHEQHSLLLRALGLAHYWQQSLDDGMFRSITEIAAAEGMDVGRVSRMLRLAQLSPVVASAIGALWFDRITPGIVIRCSIPLEWHRQRAADLGA